MEIEVGALRVSYPSGRVSGAVDIQVSAQWTTQSWR